MSNRREFIKNTAVGATGMLLFEELLARAINMETPDANGKKAQRHILLRSGWQVENIGDIAHTPAMLGLIEKYIPDAVVTFWPWYNYMPENEKAMLQKAFPNMRMVHGKLDDQGKASTSELGDAITNADFLIHNSAPATIAWADLVHFKKLGKGFGVFGVTYGLYGSPEKDILSNAAFVYFRDSVSLEKAKEAGIHAPIMEFGPDVVFSINITDDAKATTFLNEANLEASKFLCCIPKQRYTPVWLHEQKKRPFDAVKHARNEEMKEHDHLPLRYAITEVIRKTALKVLICHEDETEMMIGKEWVLDRLPEDVRKRVVWLGRPWLPDEAISIYKRSAGHFGFEMHSPIMCIAQGIPAIVVRWEEQSSKGIMWKDIGLGEWLFDFDNEEDVKRFVPTVLAMAGNAEKAGKTAVEAKRLVEAMHEKSMGVVEKVSRQN